MKINEGNHGEKLYAVTLGNSKIKNIREEG